VLYLIGLARIPVFLAGGYVTAQMYMRGVWRVLERGQGAQSRIGRSGGDTTFVRDSRRSQ
jgi:hypothetical protein